jgi:hypothetical protein
MDKASLLADTTAYITELRTCVEKLEAWVMMPLSCLLKCLLETTESNVAPHPLKDFFKETCLGFDSCDRPIWIQ